ncbi:hypothetical protein LP415_12460 [Polaromonas sp. P1(28)-8]|nr:hypothetical protein LP415_12460 [Polaromonas sp. P1(28)-8]
MITANPRIRSMVRVGYKEVKKIPLQILPWPVTGGRFQANFCLERLTRNCTKSGQLCWFLERRGCLCCSAGLAVLVPGEFRTPLSLESQGDFHEQARIDCPRGRGSYFCRLFFHRHGRKDHNFLWRYVATGTGFTLQRRTPVAGRDDSMPEALPQSASCLPIGIGDRLAVLFHPLANF